MDLDIDEKLYNEHLSDFSDLGTIRKLLKSASKWYQDHKDPINIIDKEGIQLIQLSFDA